MRNFISIMKLLWDLCGIAGDAASSWFLSLFADAGRHKKEVFFALVLTWLYMQSLGDHALLDSLEGINGAISLSMGRSGNYLSASMGTSSCGGREFGIWWLGVLGLKLFGWREIALRLWPCMGMLGVAYLCSKNTHDISRNSKMSLLSSGICASMTSAFVVSQLGSSHGLYIFFVTAAMFSFARGMFRDVQSAADARSRRRSLITAQLACVGAMLTRGLEGIFVPWLAVSIYCVITGVRESVIARNTRAILDNTLEKILSCMGYAWLAFMSMLLWVSVLISDESDAALFMFYRSLDSIYPGDLGFFSTIIAVLLVFAPWTGFIIRSVLYTIRASRASSETHNYDLYLVVWLVIFLLCALVLGDVLLMAGAVPPGAVLVTRAFYFWCGDAGSASEDRKGEISLSGTGLLNFQAAVVINILIHVPLLALLLLFGNKIFPIIKGSLLSFVPWGTFVLLSLFASWHYARTCQGVKLRRNTCLAALLCLLPLSGMFNLAAERNSPRDLVVALRRGNGVSVNALKSDDTLVLYAKNRPSVYFYAGHEYLIVRRAGVMTDGVRGVDVKRLELSDTALQLLWPTKNRVFLILRTDEALSAPMPMDVYNLDVNLGTGVSPARKYFEVLSNNI